MRNMPEVKPSEVYPRTVLGTTYFFSKSNILILY